MNNPAQLADALHRVVEVQHVLLEHARAFCCWNGNSSEENSPVAANTGTTQSNLFIWQEHLASSGKEVDTRLTEVAASIQEFKK